MRIRVIATGGTIDKVYFDAASTYEVGEPQVGPVFRESNVTFDFIVESVLQKDSLAMTDEDRALIRSRVEASPEKLISITHGTDTMTATAAKLEGFKDKVIVFTGSMQPARFRNNVRKLQGRNGYRLRVGDYRVIFDEDHVVVTILDIGPRGSVYED